MKKLICIAIVSGAFASCTGPSGMSLDEQVAAVTACRKAGGRPVEIRYAINDKVSHVTCYMEEKVDYGKPCKDKGGVPIFSSWDGTLKDCKFKR